MRDAEELWGGPRGNGENEGELRRWAGAEVLESWGRYLGELEGTAWSVSFRGVEKLTFVECLLRRKEVLSQVFSTNVIRFNNPSNPIKYYFSFTDKRAKTCFLGPQVLNL